MAATAASVNYVRLLVVLVLATAIGPFSMQVFLPALPAIQSDFAVDAAVAQAVFSLSALSIAVATLLYGPISDRFGRRPTMLAGLLVYLIGSIGSSLAPSIGLLVLGRIVQAAGGCAGMVLSRAIVRDLYDQGRSAQAIAYITMAMVAAPMIAPALGGFMTDLVGWRAVFLIGAVFGVAVLVAIMRGLPETVNRATDSQSSTAMLKSFGWLIRSRAFCGYAFQAAFSMATFFSFLGGAPYVVVEVIGLHPTDYGLFFIFVSLAFMAGNFTSARITKHIGTDRMIMAGSIGVLTSAVALVLSLAIFDWTIWSVFLPMVPLGFSQGIAMPNAMAAVVSVAPRIAGAASGLAGFLQMAIAALAAQIVGSIQNGTPYPLAIGIVSCATLTVMAAFVALNATPRSEDSVSRTRLDVAAQKKAA